MRFDFAGIDLSSRRFHIVGFACLALTVAGLLLTGKPMELTGDEPRYLMYAYSLLHHGRFVMNFAEWSPLYQASTGLVPGDIPIGGDGILPMHGVYLPTLLAPLALLGLAGLRVVTLLVGLAGLFFLLRICRQVASPGPALLAVAVAGLSVPLLPYLHLFYMEAFLFALVAFTWSRLQTPGRTLGFDLLTGVVILAIPFVHMRGAVVAAALYTMLLLMLWRAGRRRRAAGFVAMAGFALALLIGLNLLIYGVVTGPVNTARPPMPWEWFSVLSMQLFNVRHGLFAFAPVWLLGYCGLVVGLWRADRRGRVIAGQGLLLAVLAAVTGVGVNPGESWPARFWVLSIPMLAVGLAHAWNLGRSRLSRAIVVVLICVTLVNTWLFINMPNLLLENRQSTVSYQRFFDKIGAFHPGLMLPVEIDDTADIDAARDLAIGAAVFAMLMGAALRSRRSAAAIPAALLVLAALDLTRVAVVPKAAYALTMGRAGYDVTFERPMPWVYVQAGDGRQTWFVGPDFPNFSVTTTGAGGKTLRTRLAANQVVAASCAAGVAGIAVAASGATISDRLLAGRVVVYQSRSVLRTMISPLRGRC